MKQQTFRKTVLYLSLVAVAVLSVNVSAQSSSRPRGFGLYGDWQIETQFGERKMASVLSFSRNRQGQYTGQWISFWGMTELKDVKFEDGNLSFTQSVKFGENEFNSTFAGKIEQGKLTGTLSSDRGESEVTGKRALRTSRAVGNWDIKFKIGDREIASTLAITADKEGELAGKWKSQRGENEIEDLQYERGKLSFKRTIKMQDSQFETTFDGTIEGDTLTAVIKSERGEIEAEGKRIGAPLIGTWNLEIKSEQGARKQRLRVNGDMSGTYGALPVKKIDLDGEKVSFKVVLKFGEQEFEMTFDGKLVDSKLTGELKTSRGTSKVTGTKVVRTFRRRTAN